MCFNVGRKPAPLDAAGLAAVDSNLLRCVDIWRRRLGTSAAGGAYLFGAPCLADIFSAHLAFRFVTYAVDIPSVYTRMPPLADVASAADVEAYVHRLVTDLPGVSAFKAAALEEPWRIAAFEVLEDGSGVSIEGTETLKPVAD